MHKPIIIGAGLTGLTLAYLLQKRGIEAVLLEANNRIGGRIHTWRTHQNAPGVELGATWLGKKHKNLMNLLEELNLEIEEQFLSDYAIYEPFSISPPQLVALPKNEDPSYRIKGGTELIINTLSKNIRTDQIITNARVLAVEVESDQIVVKTENQTYIASQVVCTLPPRLWQSQVQFSPALPSEFFSLAAKTHTWMGESIKIGLIYSKPFWKGNNTSGTIFSNVGPLSEFYDHSDVSGGFSAIKGFMSGAYAIADSETRKNLVLAQLQKYYGEQVFQYDAYLEKVWAKEPFTYHPYDEPVLPHQNNGHPLFRQSYWEGKLFFAGSETAEQFPGYMDGAVASALLTFKQLTN